MLLRRCLVLAACACAYAQDTAPSPPPAAPLVASRVGNKRLQRAFEESKANQVTKNEAITQKITEEDDNFLTTMDTMIDQKIQAAATVDLAADTAKKYYDTQMQEMGYTNTRMDRVPQYLSQTQVAEWTQEIEGLIGEVNQLIAARPANAGPLNVTLP